MKQDNYIPSLRPYLETGVGGFRLHLTPATKEGLSDKKSGFPFLVLSESDPACRILAGKIVSDAGSPVRDVCLLTQHDTYPFAQAQIPSLTNTDIEKCWEQAFQHYNSSQESGSVFLLKEQVDDQGGPVPLGSLFFCKKKQQYFSPVCPVCGAVLRQCYDDDVLMGAGLQPYTTTAKRYLFCPACLDMAGETDFYTYRMEGSEDAPVKDRWGLIQAWGRLDKEKAALAGLPCGTCAHHEDCFGQEGRSTMHIASVAFYPFYMLLVDAPSINGRDFLSLIAGAVAENLQKHLEEKGNAGRAHCVAALRQGSKGTGGLFFRGERKAFLEILFLKIALLSDLIDLAWPRLKTYVNPEWGISLDHLWVKVQEKGRSLPAYWDFKTRVMDTAGYRIEGPPSSAQRMITGLQHLGLAWFVGLAGNGTQGQSDIWQVLNAGLEKDNGGDLSFSEVYSSQMETVFAPGSIFWEPRTLEDTGGDEAWESLWCDALELGWSLFKKGGDPDSLLQELKGRIADLQDVIKGALFAPGAPSAEKTPSQPKEKTVITETPSERVGEPDDEVIGNLLVRIGKSWVKASDTSAGGTETVMVPPVDTPPAEVPPQAVPGPDAEDDNMEATVVLSTKEAPVGDPGHVPTPQDDEVLETVMLSGGDFTEDSAGSGDVHSDVPETVILSQSTETAPLSEDMPETIIMSAPKPAPQSPPETPQAEDELLETVVVSTGQQNDAPKSMEDPPSSESMDPGMEETIAGAIPHKDTEDQEEQKDQGDQKNQGDSHETDDEDVMEETVILRPTVKD